MTARNVAIAQRQAGNPTSGTNGASDAVAPRLVVSEVIAQRVTWGELGCPQETGLYRGGGGELRVKKIHIIVAENDPAALFTVVAFRPPLGPPEFMLGHRVA